MPDTRLEDTLQGGKQTGAGFFNGGRRRQRNNPRKVRARAGEPGLDDKPFDAVGKLDQGALVGNPHLHRHSGGAYDTAVSQTGSCHEQERQQC